MATKLDVCPICGEGNLAAAVEKNLVEYKGQTGQLDAHYSVCDCCGSEQTNAVQARLNKRAVMAFRKRVDGLLTGAEVRTLREQLGISQAEAAKIFGGGPVAFSKYESDDVVQSEAMDKLLRVVSDVPEAFELLARRAGVESAGALARTRQEWPGEWETVPLEGRPRQVPRLRLITASKPEYESESHWMYA